MEPGIRSITLSSRLLALPLELRQQIYDEYYFRCSSPDLEDIHENVVPKDKNYTLPVLLVSKQVCEEVLDILKRRRQYVYRITWQEAGLDNLAISCIRARKVQCDDYASITHLRIELYPPHPDRPSDMINTLRSIQELCKDLRAIDRLQHISIVFVENHFAAWSTSGKPRMSIGYWQELEGVPDVEYVLFLFASLRNVTKVTIQLPESVPDDVFLSEDSLQELKSKHELSMTNINPLDEELINNVVETLEEDLNDNDLYIREDTGRKSLARLKALGYGDGRSMELGHFNHFKKVWPHIDSLGNLEYEGDIEYLCSCTCRIFHDLECQYLY